MRVSRAILALAVAAPALADPAPRAPDFTADLPERGVDRSFAASGANGIIAPSDEVAFALDSTVLGADAEATLDLASQWLATHPTAHLVVIAHTDRSGPAAYNDDLSNRRGHIIRDYLMSAGVATDRVVIIACGARGEAARRAILHASFDAATDTAGRCGAPPAGRAPKT
jgi:outer membrane protein OmpA-like peptidoglycan-associated protein